MNKIRRFPMILAEDSTPTPQQIAEEVRDIFAEEIQAIRAPSKRRKAIFALRLKAARFKAAKLNSIERNEILSIRSQASSSGRERLQQLAIEAESRERELFELTRFGHDFIGQACDERRRQWQARLDAANAEAEGRRQRLIQAAELPPMHPSVALKESRQRLQSYNDAIRRLAAVEAMVSQNRSNPPSVSLINA